LHDEECDLHSSGVVDEEDWEGDLSELFPSPDADPVLMVTFMLALPQCLRISHSSISVGEPGGPWPGWTHKAMMVAAGFNELPEGSRPSYVIEIGQSKVRQGVALDSAVRTFKNWDFGIGSSWSRFRRRMWLRLSAWRGQREWQSSSLVTLFVTHEGLPDPAPLFDQNWLLAKLDEAIAFLNQYLVTLAAFSDEWQISSISRFDIQRLVPFKMRLDPPVSGWKDIASSFDAHPYLPGDLGEERPSRQVIQAITMVQAARSGNVPFFQFLEHYQSAEHHLGSGRSGLAIISACTATEVFINTLFREAGRCLGTPQRKIDGALGCGFSNQLRDHLPKLISEDLDLADADSPAGKWWTDCYDLRNNIVHKGYKPTEDQALRGKTATSTFIRWILKSLNDDPRLDPIRGMVPPDA
jgi:hypothetical protein